MHTHYKYNGFSPPPRIRFLDVPFVKCDCRTLVTSLTAARRAAEAEAEREAARKAQLQRKNSFIAATAAAADSGYSYSYTGNSEAAKSGPVSARLHQQLMWEDAMMSSSAAAAAAAGSAPNNNA